MKKLRIFVPGIILCLILSACKSSTPAPSPKLFLNGEVSLDIDRDTSMPEGLGKLQVLRQTQFVVRA